MTVVPRIPLWETATENLFQLPRVQVVLVWDVYPKLSHTVMELFHYQYPFYMRKVVDRPLAVRPCTVQTCTFLSPSLQPL